MNQTCGMPYTTLFFLLLFSTHLLAQNKPDCPYYQKYIAAADAEIARGAAADFQKAINDYSTAMLHCPARAAAARERIIQAYRAIDALKDEAQAKEREARNSLHRLAQERARSQAALAEADSIFTQNKKLVDAFYFYDDKLALAYKNERYGFLNRAGEVRIDYQFEKAEQFDYNRFARVVKNSQNYLLAPSGKIYPVAYSLGELTGDVLALDLSRQKLDSFPVRILDFPQLEVLLLGLNQLISLPEEMGQLTQLTRLYLKDNQLTELPHEIGQLTQLTELNLFNNQLTELPQEMGQLTQLTELNLFSNQLTELPQQIGQLTQLTELNLFSNQLTELPQEIGQLTQLTELNLRDNQLTELPQEIGQLMKLTELNLFNNQLAELPQEMGQLTKLGNLYLINNPIPEEIITQLKTQLPKCRIEF
jgi:hypothetical protein